MSYVFCHDGIGYRPEGAIGHMGRETADSLNAAASRQEVESFKAGKPGPYFAYHKATECFVSRTVRLHYGDEITTWIGDALAKVIDAREPFRDNFGGVRQNFRALGINGATYTGTAYLSSGNYVRMRPVKGTVTT